MAWNDTKSSGDLISSADYNSGVTDQETRGIPQSEENRGSDCSGLDGQANRTLTLSESTIKSSGVVIVKNGTSLHEGAALDYTVSSNIITFVGSVWDTDYIRTIYFT